MKRYGRKFKWVETTGQMVPDKRLITYEHLVELVPVKATNPTDIEGWMIFIDKKPAYGGLLMSLTTAVLCLQGKAKKIADVQASLGKEFASWEALEGRVPEIERPTYAITPIQKEQKLLPISNKVAISVSDKVEPVKKPINLLKGNK